MQAPPKCPCDLTRVRVITWNIDPSLRPVTHITGVHWHRIQTSATDRRRYSMLDDKAIAVVA